MVAGLGGGIAEHGDIGGARTARTQSAFPSGFTPANTWSGAMPTLGDGPGRGRGIAGDHVRRSQRSRETARAPWPPRPVWASSRNWMRPAATPSMDTSEPERRPCRLRPSRRPRTPRGLPRRRARPADDGLEGGGRRQRRQVASGRVGHNGAGQGVLAPFLQGGGARRRASPGTSQATTTGSPWVRVPVLSKTAADKLPMVSAPCRP